MEFSKFDSFVNQFQNQSVSFTFFMIIIIIGQYNRKGLNIVLIFIQTSVW